MDIRGDLIAAVADFVQFHISADDAPTFDCESPFARRVQEVALRHGVESEAIECAHLINAMIADLPGQSER